jgi:hypothetical protein
VSSVHHIARVKLSLDSMMRRSGKPPHQRRAAASVSSGMVAARGREPATDDTMLVERDCHRIR